MVSTTGLSLKALLNRSLLATHRTSLVVPGTTGKLWVAVEGVVMSSSSPRHSITLKRRLRPFLESLNMPNSVRKTAKRRAHVRGLRARSSSPLRRFQTATGVPLTAPTASCDVPELPSPEPCLAYAWSRPAENRLTHTYRPTAATSRRPRWPPTPSRRPLQPGRSTGYRRAGRPSLRSRFSSCRSRLSEAAQSASATTRPPARCHDHDGPGRLLPLRTVAHDAHQPARTLWSVTAPRARPPLAGRRASLLRRRVGGAAAGASTDASALGPAAPGTRSAASSAAMGLWAVPDGGYAASTPIWLLAVGRGHHCTVGRCSGWQAARRARAA